MAICTISEKKHSVIHALLDVLSFSYDAIQKKHLLSFIINGSKKSFRHCLS